MSDPAGRIIGLYDDKADAWVTDRGPALGRAGPVLDEAAALERFAAVLPPGGTVLDVGCGSGWPWGAALLDRGLRVTGIDTSPRLIAHAAETLPKGEWIVDDMRTLGLDRTFDGLLVWYSLFHLAPEDQRTALARILAHAAPKAALLMTGGGNETGVSIGEWRGEPLYHASLDADEYRAILATHGFVVDAAPSDGDATRVWLARRAFLSAE